MKDVTIFKLLEDAGIDSNQCTLDQMNGVEYILEKVDSSSIIPLESSTTDIVEMYYDGFPIIGIAMVKKVSPEDITDIITNVIELVKVSPYVKYGLSKYFTIQRHKQSELYKKKKARKIKVVILN